MAESEVIATNNNNNGNHDFKIDGPDTTYFNAHTPQGKWETYSLDNNIKFFVV